MATVVVMKAMIILKKKMGEEGPPTQTKLHLLLKWQRKQRPRLFHDCILQVRRDAVVRELKEAF